MKTAEIIFKTLVGAGLWYAMFGEQYLAQFALGNFLGTWFYVTVVRPEIFPE